MKAISIKLFLSVIILLGVIVGTGCSIYVSGRTDLGDGAQRLYAWVAKVPSKVLVWELQQFKWVSVDDIFNGGRYYCYLGSFHFSVIVRPQGTAERVREISIYLDDELIRYAKPYQRIKIVNTRDNAGHTIKVEIPYEFKQMYIDRHGVSHFDWALHRTEEVIFTLWTSTNE